MASSDNFNVPTTKYFSLSGIIIATVIGGPLVTGYLLRQNYLKQGKEQAGLLTMVITVILVGVLVIIRLSEVFGEIPNSPLLLIYMLLALGFTQVAQGAMLKKHKELGGSFESNWKAAKIALIWLVAILLIVFAAVFLSLWLSLEDTTQTPKKLDGNWFSLDWFTKSRLKSYDWASREWFYAFAGIPFLFILRWFFVNKFRQKLPIALTKTNLKNDKISILRYFPGIFFTLALILIIIGMARPQTTNEQVERWSEGIDIMLTVDISQSMQIEDFTPNRLEAAKEVARDFVGGRFQDRIGLVVFSGDAYSRSPLTTDYDLLFTYIDDINFDLIESRGTAIGSALAVSTNRLRESEAESKVMILMSDGDNTAGNIDPITAAKLAAAYDITIYVIAIGKEGRVPYGTDFFGRTRYVENTFDETALKEIADIGGGNYYRVSDKEALVQVFNEIDQLEKAEIKETRYKDTTDFYTVYLRWAILFLLLWLVTKSTFVTNVLTD